MEQFWKKKCDIKYGQCWVFSGLVTTCTYKKTVNSIMTPLMQSNLKRRRSDKGPCNMTLDHNGFTDLNKNEAKLRSTLEER